MLKISRQAQAGFTLIEILIAVSIVAILAVSVGLPMFRYITGAKQTKATSTLSTIKVAIQSFHLDTGRYPEALRDLLEKPQNEELAEVWKGPYIEGKGVLTDPWNHKYQYQETPGTEHPYELYSYGEKGKNATAKERISVWNI